MIQKVWTKILSLFGCRTEKPLQIVNKDTKKERFLIIQDPFANKATQRVSKTASMQSQMPKNAEQIQNMYKIICNLEDREFQQQSKQNEGFIFDLREMDTVLKEIQQKQSSILEDSQKLQSQIGRVLSKVTRISLSEDEERQIYRKYVQMVQNVMELKYAGERKDYPQIQYEEFREVFKIWSTSDKTFEAMPVKGTEHLKYGHVKLLAPTHWLNDEVITEYINHMNSKLSARPGNRYIIFNSLKVKTLFEKTDYQKLERILERQKVSRNTSLVLAIHKVNHWLFVKMENAAISVYDSMLSSEQTYLNFALFHKIVKFAQQYYGTAVHIERVVGFPQQKNGWDCGMMMLCGIKDLVRDYPRWSFAQRDINYKRALATLELVQNRITGF